MYSNRTKNREISFRCCFRVALRANCGVRCAFEEALGMELVVPGPFL
ncbi:MAG: hypothetical protein ACOCW1_04990 [Chitinispirillaceae bacterium]